MQPHEQGIWSIGLVTGGGLRPLSEATGEEMVTVFVPSTPTAFSGYVLVVPRDAVVELPLTVEEAMRLLVSGGVIVPGATATPAVRRDRCRSRRCRAPAVAAGDVAPTRSRNPWPTRGADPPFTAARSRAAFSDTMPRAVALRGRVRADARRGAKGVRSRDRHRFLAAHGRDRGPEDLRGAEGQQAAPSITTGSRRSRSSSTPARTRRSVEMIVNAEHKNMFIAHHDDGDAYACIDGCVDKLERQLSEHKKKIRNRKHPEESHEADGDLKDELSVVSGSVASDRDRHDAGNWQLTTDNWQLHL